MVTLRGGDKRRAGTGAPLCAGFHRLLAGAEGIAALCSDIGSYFGLGAMGVLVGRPVERSDFRMDYSSHGYAPAGAGKEGCCKRLVARSALSRVGLISLSAASA
jgi:hypothetical protein